jgi:hypothetical protein
MLVLQKEVTLRNKGDRKGNGRDKHSLKEEKLEKSEYLSVSLGEE